MGREFLAECNQCHHKFKVREGGGRNFYLLHCDTCGEEKVFPIDQILNHEIMKEPELSLDEKVEKIAGECLEGKFKIRSKARCPKCLSNDYKIASDDSGKAEIAFYD